MFPGECNGNLVEACPEIVHNRLVAITSFDAGPLVPDDNEVRAGWRRVGDVLWTAAIEDPAVLPTAGYDEWYVFDEPIGLSSIEVFVNRLGFCLGDELSDATDRAEARSVVAAFWAQMSRLRPAAYLADGCLFNFASRDAQLFSAALKWMRSQPATS
jgi:hypothetical protein